jgi:hypothetical protein
MSLFEVIQLDEGWGVFAVNPNDPDDRELATVYMERAYAEMRAAALNRIAEVEPITQQVEIEVDDVRPFRAISLED